MVDFATVEPDTDPPALVEREQWMRRLAGEKMPFAPWADRDHSDAGAVVVRRVSQLWSPNIGTDVSEAATKA